ncbi:(deoxy)nucleoside triphosphate pyrophosphohydrolase [uncultured Nocardioides sp.]|uniref:(deoxy)nucleoside triphosphate pyrophosphohydrolase n=1 Tax=uncultured Nocardioides sp. TaxID=198441 RepID=UPI002608E64B|nr:(deoxy)nucleoside triphosphate pyrophosphohydrolase [uncultured Nocardioides sp.]
MGRGRERQVVVGAAIVRDGRVLAARRTAPASAAGRWEFPGGKVEAGETAADSLVREIDEELGARITVERWLAGAVPIGEHYVLRVAVAVLEGGEPTPSEHDELRWLAAGELDSVDWLDADRPFLTELSHLLPSLCL